MFSFSPRQWPALMPLVFAATAHAQALQAQAQAQDAVAPTVQFESALRNYTPFTDEKIVPWKQSNDTVRQVGGWRVYAREAAQPDAPADTADPHQGHHPAQQGAKP